MLGNYVRLLYRIGSKPRWILVLIIVITLAFMLAVLSGGFTSRNNRQTPSTSKMNLYDDIGERFQIRQRTLQRGCGKLRQYYVAQNSEAAVKEHLVIDRKHKLVYCAIEKVGCTFWKRTFQILSGYRNVTDPFQIKGLQAYEGYQTAKGLPFDKIHQLLVSSTKFIFVREPYERLLSAYVDKLYAPNAAYWKFIGRYIVSNFRNYASNTSLECGHDVTFKEFVEYFIYSQNTNEHRDAHFVPNFEHCRPCEIKYDFIGKLETFREDTFYILKKLGLDKTVQFTDFQNETETDAIMDAVGYVYSMKKAILDCMPFSQALARVWRKLQIRGIISKDEDFPFQLDAEDVIPRSDFQVALLHAHSRSGDSALRKRNRQEAFIEAYKTLPRYVMDRLQQSVMIDAILFGYNEIPNLLEKANGNAASVSDFRYFEYI